MFIKIKRGWELPESAATPEGVYLRRRHFLAAAGITIASPMAFAGGAQADDAADPSAGLYPVKRNETYKLDREITSEKLSTHYNNYYEFDTSKDVAELAQALPIRPWTVTIDGRGRRCGRSLGRTLSGEAQRQVQARPGHHPGGDVDPLQQLL